MTYPSQFKFPDEEMVFDIQIAHNGEHVSSNYLLSQDFNDDGGALTTRLDNGMTLGNYGTFMQLVKGEVYHRQVRVKRGPEGFEFPPVELTLKSKCETDMKVTVPLYNVVDDDGAQSLKWLEPCPSIEWAGELKRDQSFLVNTLSDDPDFLSVTIFNPEASKKGLKLSDMTDPNGRLNNAYLFYRETGEVTWNNAKNETINNVDYALDFVEEDNFGYATLKWNIGAGPLPDGLYEIVVETRCSDVGGPDEFSFSREDAITGVIDLTRPEQYGQPLPYREDVIVGEEILVVFTEPLDCSLPLSFDVQMTVEGLDSVLDKQDLNVVCEGRTIGIQVDLSVGIEPSQLLGRAFEVEIGQVGDESFGSIKDVNGNPMDPLQGNVQFTRTFGDLDLTSASTSFIFSRRLHGICDEFALGDHLADEMRYVVASTIGLEKVNAIVAKDLSCQDTRTIVASIEIQPMEESAETEARRGLGSTPYAVTTFDLYRRLKNNIVDESSKDVNGRKLAIGGEIIPRSVRIIPGAGDMVLFETNVNDKEEEELLYHLASLSTDTELTDADILRKLQNFERNLEKGLIEEVKNKEKEDDLVSLEERLTKRRKLEMEELSEQRKLEFEEMERRVLKMDGSRNVVDLKDMFMLQGLTFFIGCSIAAISVYFAFGRRG
jgi:hypothetical protein